MIDNISTLVERVNTSILFTMVRIALLFTILTAAHAFVSQSTLLFSRTATSLNMIDEECPEIPIEAQLDPKYDTAIIALG